MAQIFPTHSCFDDALDFIEARLRANPADLHLVLVHGIALAPSGPHASEPFAHAWVEEHGVVWNSGLLDSVPVCFSVERDDFYASLRIQACTRYSLRDAWRENQRSGNYGPWKAKYRALCGGRRLLGEIHGRSA